MTEFFVLRQMTVCVLSDLLLLLLFCLDYRVLKFPPLPLSFSLSSLPETLLLSFYPISPINDTYGRLPPWIMYGFTSCFHVVSSLFWQDSFSEFSHIGAWSFWRSFYKTLWPLPAYLFSLSCCFSLQPWLSAKAYDESLRNTSFNCSACY